MPRNKHLHPLDNLIFAWLAIFRFVARQQAEDDEMVPAVWTDNQLIDIIMDLAGMRARMSQDERAILNRCAKGEFSTSGAEDEPEDYFTPTVLAKIMAHKLPSRLDFEFFIHIKIHELADYARRTPAAILDMIKYRAE